MAPQEALKVLQPVDVERFLLGMRSLIPGEAVKALTAEVHRRQMDGLDFSSLVASRTMPDLGDALRPHHMATLRRCWTTKYGSSETPAMRAPTYERVLREMDGSTAMNTPQSTSAGPGRRALFDKPGEGAASAAAAAFRPPTRAAWAEPARPDSAAGFGAGPQEEPPATPPRAAGSPRGFQGGDSPYSPDCNNAWAKENDNESVQTEPTRPPQVPRLDLTDIMSKAGNYGETRKLASHQWMKPTKSNLLPPPPHKPNQTAQPVGFAWATSEDQQKVADFYGYRDEGFVATMYGLQTDEIRPRLYLGTMADAAYWPLLEAHGITHVLNVAVEAQKMKPPYEQHLVYKCMAIQDTPEYAAQMPRHRFRELREATKFIYTNLKASGRRDTNVLVHCVQGLSRGAAIVCAYLMEYEGLPMEKALGEIQRKHRGCLAAHHWQVCLHKFNAELFKGF